jgi:hypothetical protein
VSIEHSGGKKRGRKALEKGAQALALAAGLLVAQPQALSREIQDLPGTKVEAPDTKKPHNLKDEREAIELVKKIGKISENYFARLSWATKMRIDGGEKFESIEKSANPKGTNAADVERALEFDSAFTMLRRIDDSMDMIVPILKDRDDALPLVRTLPRDVRSSMRHVLELWKNFHAIQNKQAKEAAIAYVARYRMFKMTRAKRTTKAISNDSAEGI